MVAVQRTVNGQYPNRVYNVAATSWHWIDASAALPKVAATLRPGGGLAIWWTIFGPHDQPQTEFRSMLEPLYTRFMPDERDDGLPPKPMRIHEWQEQLQIGGWFAAPDVEVIRWTQPLAAGSARALWATFPNVEELPDAERAGFLDGVPPRSTLWAEPLPIHA